METLKRTAPVAEPTLGLAVEQRVLKSTVFDALLEIAAILDERDAPAICAARQRLIEVYRITRLRRRIEGKEVPRKVA